MAIKSEEKATWDPTWPVVDKGFCEVLSKIVVEFMQRDLVKKKKSGGERES